MNVNEIEIEKVKGLVSQLIDQADMTPQTIAEALEHRVSSRTIYRWARGESVPGNTFDYEALVTLVREKCG